MKTLWLATDSPPFLECPAVVPLGGGGGMRTGEHHLVRSATVKRAYWHNHVDHCYTFLCLDIITTSDHPGELDAWFVPAGLITSQQPINIYLSSWRR